MGYTHYWDYKPTVSEEVRKKEFKKVVSDTKKILKNKGDIVIRGWDGTGKPLITNEKIKLNGDGENGLDHETFEFSVTKYDSKWGFCKTARKPYDTVVCAILLSMKKHLSGFTFYSDGDIKTEEEWIIGRELYNSINK